MAGLRGDDGRVGEADIDADFGEEGVEAGGGVAEGDAKLGVEPESLGGAEFFAVIGSEFLEVGEADGDGAGEDFWQASLGAPYDGGNCDD